MSIYKTCNISGDAVEELSPALYQDWGLALGKKLSPGAKFVVGGDGRASTPLFMAALVDGLCQVGMDVVELGTLPTPMVHYAGRRIKASGAAIVTASHEPAGRNGLQWTLKDLPPQPHEVSALGRALNNSKPQPETSRRLPRQLDVSFDYVAHLQEAFVDSLGARLHVVLDPVHGCWAEKARRYLHAVFPQCLFSTIRDVADPSFEGRKPDCSASSNLAELCSAVYGQRAHVGVAFDGDGDRLVLVDELGVALSPEQAMWSLLNCVGRQINGSRLVFDVGFSDRVVEAARQLGAEPILERGGYAFIRTRMRESGAVFGAGGDGTYFHGELDGCDDALYTVCRLIAYLSASGRALSELRRSCPPVYITPEVVVAVPSQLHPEIIDQVHETWKAFPQQSIDGLRVNTPGGWALVRPAPAESALRFRFEGLDWHAVDDLVERFCDSLPELGDELWTRYRAAMGTAGQ